MSRIHEALKKAEQERAATQGGAAQANFAATPMADPAVYQDAPPSTLPPVTTGTPGMPAFSSPYSVDSLLARCPQMEWKPDLGNDAVHEWR